MPTFTFDETTPAPTPDALSDDVKLLHSYPRFHHTSDFDVGSDDYLKGLAFVGATVIALAAFLLLVYTLFLFARCCCKCRKFSPDDIAKHHERCPPRAQRVALPNARSVSSVARRGLGRHREYQGQGRG